MNGMVLRALQYLEVAGQSQPGSVHTGFVRVKVYLEQGDAEAAADQIGRLIACDGFDPAILQVEITREKRGRLPLLCVQTLCIKYVRLDIPIPVPTQNVTTSRYNILC